VVSTTFRLAVFRPQATESEKIAGYCYWDFLTGQVPVEVAQQELGLVQAFLVIGQVFVVAHWVGHLLVEQHPVTPKDATQTTERRVRMDFILVRP